MKLRVPSTAGELQAMMDDPKVAGDIIANGQLTEFVTAYQRALAETQPEIQNQVDAMVQTAMARHGVMRPQLGGPEIGPGAIANAAQNRNAPGAALNQAGYAHVGDFARDLFLQSSPNSRPSARFDKALEIQNAFSSNDPSAGGFLIPETMRSDIMSLSLERSIVRPRASVMTMAAPTQLIPFCDFTDDRTTVFGGFSFGWTPEAGTIAASNATFGRIKLEAWKLGGYSLVPNELFQDANGLNSWLMQALPAGIAFTEDAAFFTGNGVGQPLGFLNAANTALIVQAAEGSQQADTIVPENILSMYARMLPSSLERAIWIVSPTCVKELMTMSISVGTGGAPVMLVDMSTAPKPTMLGRPLIISEKASAIGDQGDIAFVDLEYYAVGDRQAVSLETSEHVAFQSDQTAVRIIERVDGRPWITSPLTPLHGDTLSPFVVLAAR